MVYQSYYAKCKLQFFRCHLCSDTKMPSINTEARPSNCSADLANHSSTEWQPYTISLYNDSHTPLSLYDEKDLSSFSCLPEVGSGVSYLNRLQQLRDTFVCSYSSKFLIVLNHPYLVGCLPLLQNKSLLFLMYMKDKKIAWQNKLLNNGISRLYVHWQSTGTTHCLCDVEKFCSWILV